MHYSAKRGIAIACRLSVRLSVDCPFWMPLIISGTGKVTNFKFCTHIHTTDRNKSLLQISAKVAMGKLRDSRNFLRAPIYRAHRAVTFAIAQLSCLLRLEVANVYD